MSEHIKMPAVTPIVRYLADGENTIFAYPFPIFDADDLSVYIDGARQITGFTVQGAGDSFGGSVIFDGAPAEGMVIVLERFLSLERVSDFMQGGAFSAQSLNNELDYLTAGLQQVSRENKTTLRYSDHEEPSDTILPAKAVRAGKALGFDGDGNPIAVQLGEGSGASDYVASGFGALPRTPNDKLSDMVSVKDYGAVGDGLVDDTLAIQRALSAHQSLYIPAGEYLISDTLSLNERQSLIGQGAASRLYCVNNNFAALSLGGGFITVQNLAIEGGLIGVELTARLSPCVQNRLLDLHIVGAVTGIALDGGHDVELPCYWNDVSRVVIEGATLHGVYLTKSGLGDSPNANRFYGVHVYAKGASTTGNGFYVEYGALNNSFIDCEANMKGSGGHSCFRVGPDASRTLVMNLLCEGDGGMANVYLDSGSSDTFIMNLTAMSDGPAIEDYSGNAYNAVNAGYPDKNTLRKTNITDLTASLMRYETSFIDTAGTTDLTPDVSVYIVNAINGGITLRLPVASADNNGAVVTMKKVDQSDNVITVTDVNGNGPDGVPFLLGEHNDYITVISNGAAWYVMASNRVPGSTRYLDTTGTVDVDMAVDTYLVSSYNGVLEMRLPPADAAEVIGRSVTIKKTDPSSNAVNVTEQGGAGPDNASQSLTARYHAITVVSNGASWFVTNRYTG